MFILVLQEAYENNVLVVAHSNSKEALEKIAEGIQTTFAPSNVELVKNTRSGSLTKLKGKFIPEDLISFLLSKWSLSSLTSAMIEVQESPKEIFPVLKDL